MQDTIQTLTLGNQAFVVLPRDEYERLRAAAGELSDLGPELPPANERGNFPAVEYARVSLARKLIRRRRALGLTQAELARRAGIRPETLNRIEKATRSPTVESVTKLDNALREAESNDQEGITE